MCVHVVKIGSYGNSVLPAAELRSLAHEALSGEPRIEEIQVFFMDTPYSGGSSAPLSIIIDSIEDDILTGKLQDGRMIAFFLRDPLKAATFIVAQVD